MLRILGLGTFAVVLAVLVLVFSFILCSKGQYLIQTSRITPMTQASGDLNNIKSLLIENLKPDEATWDACYRRIQPTIQKEIGNDPWGNEYQFNEGSGLAGLSGILDSPRTEQSPLDIEPEVFSTGPDGRSKSRGNDVDDINSWDDHHHAYYLERQVVIHRKRGFVGAGLISPFIFVGILFAIRRVQQDARKKAVDEALGRS